jgi:hypothetical protein
VKSIIGHASGVLISGVDDCEHVVRSDLDAGRGAQLGATPATGAAAVCSIFMASTTISD